MTVSIDTKSSIYLLTFFLLMLFTLHSEAGRPPPVHKKTANADTTIIARDITDNHPTIIGYGVRLNNHLITTYSLSTKIEKAISDDMIIELESNNGIDKLTFSKDNPFDTIITVNDNAIAAFSWNTEWNERTQWPNVYLAEVDSDQQKLSFYSEASREKRDSMESLSLNYCYDESCQLSTADVEEGKPLFYDDQLLCISTGDGLCRRARSLFKRTDQTICASEGCGNSTCSSYSAGHQRHTTCNDCTNCGCANDECSIKTNSWGDVSCTCRTNSTQCPSCSTSPYLTSDAKLGYSATAFVLFVAFPLVTCTAYCLKTHSVKNEQGKWMVIFGTSAAEYVKRKAQPTVSNPSRSLTAWGTYAWNMWNK